MGERHDVRGLDWLLLHLPFPALKEVDGGGGRLELSRRGRPDDVDGGLDVVGQEQRGESSEALLPMEELVKDGELLGLVEARHGIVKDNEVRLLATYLMHEQDEGEGVSLAEAQMVRGRLKMTRGVLMFQDHPVGGTT